MQRVTHTIIRHRTERANTRSRQSNQTRLELGVTANQRKH